MMDQIQENILKDCTEKLAEYFDAALILVCRTNDGKQTMSYHMRGNDFTAIGMAHTFVEMQKSDKIGVAVKEAFEQGNRE